MRVYQRSRGAVSSVSLSVPPRMPTEPGQASPKAWPTTRTTFCLAKETFRAIGWSHLATQTGGEEIWVWPLSAGWFRNPICCLARTKKQDASRGRREEGIGRGLTTNECLHASSKLCQHRRYFRPLACETTHKRSSFDVDGRNNPEFCAA